MIRYCAGFMFDKTLRHVLLITKNKPAWQAGRLNAIGGKIEAHETAAQAMMRECLEETNILLRAEHWRRFCVLRGSTIDGAHYAAMAANHPELKSLQDAAEVAQRTEWEVHFFSTVQDISMLHNASTMTSEPVALHRVCDVTVDNAIPNVPWLLTMASSMDKDLHRRVCLYRMTEQYYE